MAQRQRHAHASAGGKEVLRGEAWCVQSLTSTFPTCTRGVAAKEEEEEVNEDELLSAEAKALLTVGADEDLDR